MEEAAAQLPGHAQGADVARLLEGLARLRPQLAPGTLAAAAAAATATAGGVGSEGGGSGAEGGAAGGAVGGGASNVAVWAAEHAELLARLLEGAAPVLHVCGPRQLASVERGVAALGVVPGRAFATALAGAAEARGAAQ